MTRDTDCPYLHDSPPDHDSPSDHDPPSDHGSPSNSEISTAELAALLRDEQRRRVLRCLDADEGTVSLSTLADRLADGDEARDRIALRLHHVHLPKLADFGLLSYDSAEKVVTLARIPAWAESSQR